MAETSKYKHGSQKSYTHGKCRCRLCRDAHNTYLRYYREMRSRLWRSMQADAPKRADAIKRLKQALRQEGLGVAIRRTDVAFVLRQLETVHEAISLTRKRRRRDD